MQKIQKICKKGIIFIIAVTVIFASMGVALGSEQPVPLGVNINPITPYWIGLSSITESFQILSGGIANPIIDGVSYAGAVDYVNVKVSLKRSNGTGWTTIKSWNQNLAISLNQFMFNETYNVIRGYSYMYSATIKSYKNGLLLDTYLCNSRTIRY